MANRWHRTVREGAANTWAGALSCLAFASGIWSLWGEALLLVAVVCAILIYTFFRATSRHERLRAYFYYLPILPLCIVLFAWLFQEKGVLDGTTGQSVRGLADCVYFSIVTWTTLGYGDMKPSVASRPWAAGEALAGYVYMGFLIAWTLSLLQGKSDRIEPDNQAEQQ